MPKWLQRPRKITGRNQSTQCFRATLQHKGPRSSPVSPPGGGGPLRIMKVCNSMHGWRCTPQAELQCCSTNLGINLGLSRKYMPKAMAGQQLRTRQCSWNGCYDAIHATACIGYR